MTGEKKYDPGRVSRLISDALDPNRVNGQQYLEKIKKVVGDQAYNEALRNLHIDPSKSKQK